MASNLLTPFLSAFQASLSVLLTIFVGVVAAQFNLLSQDSSKEISKTCVRLFLPALLIYNVGSQISLDTAGRYVPVLIWAILYNVVSIGIGFAANRLFALPQWVTPAIAFNNTTSLPLILIKSLQSTGILSSILISSSDTQSDAVERATSYFLVNSLVSNCITFAIGPQLLNAHEEDAPDKPLEKGDGEDERVGTDEGEDSAHSNSKASSRPRPRNAEDVERGLSKSTHQTHDRNDEVTEESSLLPDRVTREAREAERAAYAKGKKWWDRLPHWGQSTLSFLFQFINAPVIGAAIGLLIGLVPALHRICFNDMSQGGFLKAWLMDSIKNVGDLFAALQIVVVGVKLSKALRAMKAGKGEQESGKVPWGPAAFVEVVRFVMWPLISIPLIWVIATKTTWLSKDPILWFAMMLMPTGPPAMKLTALADVSGADGEQKMSIAKFLTLSYAISPIIAFAVVGSLKATEAAVRDAT